MSPYTPRCTNQWIAYPVIAFVTWRSNRQVLSRGLLVDDSALPISQHPLKELVQVNIDVGEMSIDVYILVQCFHGCNKSTPLPSAASITTPLA